MNLVCVRLLNEALCVFVSFLDTFETFFNVKNIVFIHISLIFIVNFRNFHVLIGNFELGVGRGVGGTRKNHPSPKDPGNRIFRSVPKICQNLSTQLFLEKKNRAF